MFLTTKLFSAGAVVLLAAFFAAQPALAAMPADCCSIAKEAGMQCSHCNPSVKAEVGKAAPDFSLKDAEGKPHQLSDSKDKIIVLTWVNPGCPFIQAHDKAGTLEKLAKAYDPEKVVFLKIDSTATTAGGSAERTLDAAKQYDQKIPALLDPEGKVGRIYQAKTTPHVFVIDAKGTLAYAGALDNSPLGRTAEGEQPVNYIKQTVDALLAGEKPPVETTKSYGCAIKYLKTEESH